MEIESGISPDYLPMDPKRLLERMHTALNSRDLTNLLKLMQVDFELTRPAAPGTDTTGLEPVRENWDNIFTKYPDFHADLLRQALEGNIIWSEWRWYGKSENGDTINQAGVIIMGIEQGLIAWTRSYMHDVTEG